MKYALELAAAGLISALGFVLFVAATMIAVRAVGGVL